MIRKLLDSISFTLFRSATLSFCPSLRSLRAPSKAFRSSRMLWRWDSDNCSRSSIWGMKTMSFSESWGNFSSAGRDARKIPSNSHLLSIHPFHVHVHVLASVLQRFPANIHRSHWSQRNMKTHPISFRLLKILKEENRNGYRIASMDSVKSAPDRRGDALPWSTVVTESDCRWIFYKKKEKKKKKNFTRNFFKKKKISEKTNRFQEIVLKFRLLLRRFQGILQCGATQHFLLDHLLRLRQLACRVLQILRSTLKKGRN